MLQPVCVPLNGIPVLEYDPETSLSFLKSCLKALSACPPLSPTTDSHHDATLTGLSSVIDPQALTQPIVYISVYQEYLYIQELPTSELLFHIGVSHLPFPKSHLPYPSSPKSL